MYFCSRHCQHLQTKPDVPWRREDVDLFQGADAAELVVAGIYIRLFIANPGWVLRKPREFLTELMENALQIMGSQVNRAAKLPQRYTMMVNLLSY